MNMEKRFSLLLLIFLIPACGRPSFFKPVKPAVQKLPNGLEILAIEDHELPTAQFFLYIRGGSVTDPKGKEGLSSVAMQAIRLGGGGGIGPDEIEETLEFTGASLEMGTNQEFWSVSLSLLRKDLETGLGILLKLLQRPALDPDRLETIKRRTKEALERKKENPLALAYQEYPSLVYGEESPWGRRPTLASIDRITRDDVVRFHREFIHPDRVIVAFSGDFSVDRMVSLIEKGTKDWRPAGVDLPSIPPLKDEDERRVALIPRKGVTQATILMGHLGAKRDNPDKFPLLVMNFILGGSGSLTSRLGEEIRSSAGKAYAVWSDFGFGRDYGLFKAVAQTSLDNTQWVMQKMESMIRETSTSPRFKQEEIERAKRAILHSLFFDFETRFAQVKEEARFRLWGYPENYLEIFQREISKVSEADLERVARRYLHPDGLRILLITEEGEIPKFHADLIRRVD